MENEKKQLLTHKNPNFTSTTTNSTQKSNDK